MKAHTERACWCSPTRSKAEATWWAVARDTLGLIFAVVGCLGWIVILGWLVGGIK